MALALNVLVDSGVLVTHWQMQTATISILKTEGRINVWGALGGWLDPTALKDGKAPVVTKNFAFSYEISDPQVPFNAETLLETFYDKILTEDSFKTATKAPEAAKKDAPTVVLP